MLDAIGFGLASAFLATTFTVFLAIDRFVSGVATEFRYSIAPSMVSGVRGWAHDCAEGARVSSPRSEDGAAPAGPPPDGAATEPPDPGFRVPVAPLEGSARL